MIHHGEEVSRKLSEMENKDEMLASCMQSWHRRRKNICVRLAPFRKSDTRPPASWKKLVEAEINDLAMKSRFHIEVSGTDEEGKWTRPRFDQVVYMISTNPGDPLRQLEHIASGGELSRVMLALKVSVEASVAGKKASVARAPSAAHRTLIFDEIDTGIGGRAAEAVGKKLKALSRANQVLCVTHLPQIATFADHHYLIEKKTPPIAREPRCVSSPLRSVPRKSPACSVAPS